MESCFSDHFEPQSFAQQEATKVSLFATMLGPLDVENVSTLTFRLRIERGLLDPSELDPQLYRLQTSLMMGHLRR